MIHQPIEELQRVFCLGRGSYCALANPDSKLGFARQTEGRLPINGVRRPPQGETNGWYIWCGEELSSDPDFFSPIHTRHLAKYCPEILRYLGLPPGLDSSKRESI